MTRIGDVLERPLRGEPLPLDLVNTRWVEGAATVDLLDRPGAVAAWLRQHDLEVEADPVQVEHGLRVVRDALRGVVDDPADGAALDAVLALGRVRLGWADGVATTRTEVPEAWRPAWTVAAAYLQLIAERPDRVRRCDGRGCVLVFADTSRNGRRRWCSMEACGARAKAADYYRRRTGQPPVR